jgi:hypothetical protein
MRKLLLSAAVTIAAVAALATPAFAWGGGYHHGGPGMSLNFGIGVPVPTYRVYRVPPRVVYYEPAPTVYVEPRPTRTFCEPDWWDQWRRFHSGRCWQQ